MKYLLLFLSLVFLAACDERTNDDNMQESQKTVLTVEQRTRVKSMATASDGTVSYKDSFNALDPLVKRSTVALVSGFDPADDYWGLPRTPGYEEVDAYCSGCHSLSIVMQQRVTGERWESLIKWMVDKQGMPPLSEEEDELVKAYLARHFSDIPE